MDLPKGRKVIKNHWVFNVKSDSCYKSWLIVKGFSQVKGIDFDKLFSPVVCYEIAHLFVRNRLATEPVILKLYNTKLSFDI